MGINFSTYRLFLMDRAGNHRPVGRGAAIHRFGAQVRAAVENQRMALGLGIDVDGVFAIAFALGSGLAGLGAHWRSKSSVSTRTSLSPT